MIKISSVQSALCALTILFFLSTSCKKDTKEEEALQPMEVVEVSKLKVFLSQFTGIDTTHLEYDSKSGFFKFRGVNQINREDLTFAYIQNIENRIIK